MVERVEGEVVEGKRFGRGLGWRGVERGVEGDGRTVLLVREEVGEREVEGGEVGELGLGEGGVGVDGGGGGEVGVGGVVGGG
ncbi:hypothetical protein, partial [Curtobacterium sp. 9128]|uniref:hypothetical protein n=1 Tax=Curtobacterium sp. 9128 TaxID=1793722 RepID=UPI0016425B92